MVTCATSRSTGVPHKVKLHMGLMVSSSHAVNVYIYVYGHVGMMGVVVELVLEVRRRIPIVSVGYTKRVKSGADAVRAVGAARAKCDALFAILVPDRNYVYLETREKVSRCAACVLSSQGSG